MFLMTEICDRCGKECPVTWYLKGPVKPEMRCCPKRGASVLSRGRQCPKWLCLILPLIIGVLYGPESSIALPLPTEAHESFGAAVSGYSVIRLVGYDNIIGFFLGAILTALGLLTGFIAGRYLGGRMKTVFRWLMSWIFCAPKKSTTGAFRSASSWTAPNRSKQVLLRQIASHHSQNCTSEQAPLRPIDAEIRGPASRVIPKHP